MRPSSASSAASPTAPSSATTISTTPTPTSSHEAASPRSARRRMRLHRRRVADAARHGELARNCPIPATSRSSSSRPNTADGARFRQTRKRRYLGADHAAGAWPRALRPRGRAGRGVRLRGGHRRRRPRQLCWINAAYAMAVRITGLQANMAGCTRIRGVQSGGDASRTCRRTSSRPTTGGSSKCPTEIAISDRREAELSAAGLLPLIHRKNTDQATFIGAQTVLRAGRVSRTRPPRPTPTFGAPALHFAAAASPIT